MSSEPLVSHQVGATSNHDCREAGARATQGAVAEVGQRREHDYREVGARVTPGAVTELSRGSAVRVAPGAPMFQQLRDSVAGSDKLVDSM